MTELSLGFIALYFLPILFAVMRGHRNALAITALTILLGWTLIGWVVATVWSLTDNCKPKGEIFNNAGKTKEGRKESANTMKEQHKKADKLFQEKVVDDKTKFALAIVGVVAALLIFAVITSSLPQ